MNDAFFFQTQQITNHTILFNQLKEQNIFFSYFQVDQNYYLFVYAQKSIDINFLYQSLDVIQELDSKQRKIRSFRGFFLYALEIMETGKEYEILQTNLQPFFWRKIKNIIRQNQKGALLEFLFGKDQDNKLVNQGSNPAFDDKIQNLQNQINSLAQQVERLQQKIIQLESNLENSEYALRGTLHAPDDRKTIQQGDSTLEGKKAPYLQENYTKINSNLHQGEEPRHQISKTVSEDKITPVQPLSNSQRYDISPNIEKGLNEPNFITLGKISEEEKIEIIKIGFRLNQERKISLKKYYESTDPCSLFQLKGYSIKYESIRRTKLYQKLKPSNKPWVIET